MINLFLSLHVGGRALIYEYGGQAVSLSILSYNF